MFLNERFWIAFNKQKSNSNQSAMWKQRREHKILHFTTLQPFTFCFEHVFTIGHRHSASLTKKKTYALRLSSSHSLLFGSGYEYVIVIGWWLQAFFPIPLQRTHTLWQTMGSNQPFHTTTKNKAPSRRPYMWNVHEVDMKSSTNANEKQKEKNMRWRTERRARELEKTKRTKRTKKRKVKPKPWKCIGTSHRGGSRRNWHTKTETQPETDAKLFYSIFIVHF